MNLSSRLVAALIFVTSGFFVAANVSQAMANQQDRPACGKQAHELLDLITDSGDVDETTNATAVARTYRLNGKIIKSDVASVTGDVCSVAVGFYTPVGELKTSMSVDTTLSFPGLWPFGHVVSVENDPASQSCQLADPDNFSAYSSWTQESGWRKTYTTEIKMSFVEGGVLLTYIRSDTAPFSVGRHEQMFICLFDLK